MRGRVRRLAAAALFALALGGCATFPDEGPRTWQDQIEEPGSLGDIPRVPVPSEPPSTGTPPPEDPSGGPPPTADPCDDPDPAVVETCLDPVGAIAVLPDGAAALVAERTTGRVLRVEQGTDPVLVATVPVDPRGNGGLTGLVLSPSYAEDGLLYAYATTSEDNRVLVIAEGEPPKPLLTGIPRGETNNGGAMAVDLDGSLLVATGDAGLVDTASLAGKVLRLDTLGRPATDNPDPSSPVLASGLTAPGGICINPITEAAWVTDRAGTREMLHQLVPGELGPAAWSWQDRPGVGGCAALQDRVAVAQSAAEAVYVIRTVRGGGFVGTPESLLVGEYGRFGPAALALDGSVWLGTVNRDEGGNPGPTDDRVIRIEFGSGGEADRA